jgi:hypothetical protein
MPLDKKCHASLLPSIPCRFNFNFKIVEVMISANLKRHKKEIIYISMIFDNTCGMVFENLMESIT